MLFEFNCASQVALFP